MLKNGFTLVELMVVISIISVLASIGFVSYQVVFKNSRDAKRQGDLRTIQTALEQYFADQLYYPLLASGTCPSSALTEDGKLRFGCPLKSPDSTKTYIQTVPVDSVTTNSQYSYQPPANCDNTGGVLNCTTYCLYAKMENASNPGTVSCPYTGSFSSYNYVLTPP